MAATSALLGTGQTSHALDLAKWDFDIATLNYSESDERVQAQETSIAATHNINSETSLGVKLVYDTLSGASPNGATPSDRPQTFSGASGKSSYTAEANAQPLDTTFRDMRYAGSLQWTAPYGSDWSYSTGAYGSTEGDYQSLGVNFSLSRYLNKKNTTLTLGVSLASDTVYFDQAFPDGLSRKQPSGYASDDDDEEEGEEQSRNKKVNDLLLGVTQVLGKNALVQVNYSVNVNSGYLTDAYKLLSVIDDNAGSNYGGNVTEDGEFVYVHEKRPEERTRHAIYTQLKYHLWDRDTVELGYRYMSDDWGIHSNTYELRYRLVLNKHYLEPQLRWYNQSRADFYRRYITASEYLGATHKYASADYRLGDMQTRAIALRYGYRLSQGREGYVRLSLYAQENTGEKGIGKLTQQQLYPDTSAVMVMLGVKF